MVKRYEPEPIDGKLCVMFRDDSAHFVEHSDYEKLEQENADLKDENKLLAKKSAQRGARMQIMAEWLMHGLEVDSSKLYDWFDDDGVPL